MLADATFVAFGDNAPLDWTSKGELCVTIKGVALDVPSELTILLDSLATPAEQAADDPSKVVAAITPEVVMRCA